MKTLKTLRCPYLINEYGTIVCSRSLVRCFQSPIRCSSMLLQWADFGVDDPAFFRDWYLMRQTDNLRGFFDDAPVYRTHRERVESISLGTMDLAMYPMWYIKQKREESKSAPV